MLFPNNLKLIKYKKRTCIKITYKRKIFNKALQKVLRLYNVIFSCIKGGVLYAT